MERLEDARGARLDASTLRRCGARCRAAVARRQDRGTARRTCRRTLAMAAPIHRAIEAGDTESGVTIMQMDAGLDTGPMLLQKRIAIGPDATTTVLHDALANLGARLMVQALENPAALQALAQSDEGVCYAHKIDKAEAAIDWQQPAAQIARKVRAFDPFPGASTRLGEETLKVWGAQAIALRENDGVSALGLAAHPEGMQGDADPGHRGAAIEAVDETTSFALRQSGAVAAENTTGAGGPIRPGQILASDHYGLIVGAGAGSFLRITHLQRPGGKRLAMADYLQGHPLAPGLCFDGPAALNTV
jgi:methionyl-tRNA formyltransferase